MSGTGGRPREKAPAGYFTIREVADLLGVRHQAIRNRMETGTVPFEKSLKPNGRPSYYIKKEVIEQEMKKRAGGGQRSSEAQTDLEGIYERLDELSEGQEELQQTLREILADTRNDAPRTRPDQPEPTVGNNTAPGETNGQTIPYERADDPELLELIGRDVRGNSTPEEHAPPRSPKNLQLWRDGLRAILSDLQTQFIERRATAEKFRTECFRKGESGKQEWFNFKAELDAWKGGGGTLQAQCRDAFG